jgi:CRP-like cAMP-binding protein
MSISTQLVKKLIQIPIFGGLTIAEAAEFFEVALETAHSKDSTIFREGDDGEALLVILEGEVQVTRKGIELARVGKNSVLGEMSLVGDGEVRSATATALTDVKTLTIPSKRVQKMLKGDSVAALKPVSLLDFDRRLRAVVEFARRPEAEALAAANKRIANILRQAHEKGMAPTGAIDSAAIEGGAEASLEHAIAQAIEALEPMLAQHRYVDALARLAALREPVDAFFDGVMVMAEGPAQRNNRLLMLDRLRKLFLRIADVSVLAKQG